MQCPKCSYEPTLSEITQSPDCCPSCGVYYAKVRLKPKVDGASPASKKEFGRPLRCPDCGAYYEKEGMQQKNPSAVLKRRSTWWIWLLVGLFVIGWLNTILNPPTVTTPAKIAAAAPAPSAALIPNDAANVAPTVEPLKVPDPAETALASVTLDYKWGKKHESLMIANFKVTNNGLTDVKDIEIECVHSGASGTRIDSNKRTIYEVVPAHRSMEFKRFDMGFIHSQAVKSKCSIVSLKL